MNRNGSRAKTSDLKLVYIIGTYPLLTTTFIDREIDLLRQRGVTLRVISIRRPSRKLSPGQEERMEDVTYLLPVNLLALLMAHLWFALLRPGAYWQTLFYLVTRPHPTTRARLKTVLHFGEGVYGAHLARQQAVDQVHAHFADRAATVALTVSRLLDVPYSLTAHANDIYVNPVMLPEKMAQAKFVATCTQYNLQHLQGIANNNESEGELHCIYHGLDLSNYLPKKHEALKDEQALLIAVGQLKEKKGFTYLLEACRLLKDRGYKFRCEIVGEGPLRNRLQEQIRQLDLENTVTLCGALPHAAVIEKYEQATVFTLPCVLSADGDRDGIPNVILEAMAMELPVISTRHSGIPEVIEDGVNGILVPPAQAEALAKALARLLDDPEGRLKYGKKGRETIMKTFAVEPNAEKLLVEFLA